jgi:hypothetical protein
MWTSVTPSDSPCRTFSTISPDAELEGVRLALLRAERANWHESRQTFE